MVRDEYFEEGVNGIYGRQTDTVMAVPNTVPR
jgi:hypothetical protein